MPAFATPMAYVLVFVAVVLLAQSAAGLIFASRDRAGRVNRRLGMLDRGLDPAKVYDTLVRRTPAPKLDVPFILRGHAVVETYLRQAGLSLSPARLLAIAAAIAAVLWLLALSIAQPAGFTGLLMNGLTSLIGAVALSVAGVWLWVRALRIRRIKRIERQLPVGLDIINRAIRAGHPVVSAVRLASEELSDPIGTEFGLIVDETAYGYDFREALTNFARRTGSGDAHFFAVSVSIQADTGGNLAEILEGLAAVIRGRHTLAQRVRSLSSEGRMSALLISVLPLFVISAQMLIRPRIYIDKFSDPIFWPVVGVTLIEYAIGWLIVRRIINFRY
jgi:tight adherence protein B